MRRVETGMTAQNQGRKSGYNFGRDAYSNLERWLASMGMYNIIPGRRVLTMKMPDGQTMERREWKRLRKRRKRADKKRRRG